MLRSILLAALILSSLTFSLGAFAHQSSGDDEQIIPISDNRPVPWPWSMAQPFPWTDIQGVWKVQQDDYTSYFSLKVVRQKATGLRQLQVKQYDGATCRVLATGGVLSAKQRFWRK